MQNIIKEYSITIGLKKAIINLILIGGPIAIQMLPADWMNLTLSGALYMIVNYIKVKTASE